LWIRGAPGKGKTILSVYLCEELERAVQGVDGSELICYFFNSRWHSGNNAASLMRGLLRQLVNRRPSLSHDMSRHLDSPEKAQETVKLPDRMWNMFIKAVQTWSIGKIFCVIDGLDECDAVSQQWLISKLFGSTLVGRMVKFTIVSRDIPGLRQCEMQVNLGEENDASRRKDIQMFISSKMQVLSKAIPMEASLQATIAQQLLDKAGGTFLWVGLAVAELQTKRTAAEVKQALKDLPKGLSAMYRRMLEDIGPDYQANAIVLLRWIALSEGTIWISSLNSLIDTPPRDETGVSAHQVIQDQLAMCGAILEKSEYCVRLVHESAKDFLLRRHSEPKDYLQDFCVTEDDSHARMAEWCLNMLHSHNLDPILKHEYYLSASHEFAIAEACGILGYDQHPMLAFAILELKYHLRDAHDSIASIFHHPSGFFTTNSKLRNDWWQLAGDRPRPGQQLSTPALHLACYLQIHPWVRFLVVNRDWKSKYLRTGIMKQRDGGASSSRPGRLQRSRTTTISCYLCITLR